MVASDEHCECSCHSLKFCIDGNGYLTSAKPSCPLPSPKLPAVVTLPGTPKESKMWVRSKLLLWVPRRTPCNPKRWWGASPNVNGPQRKPIRQDYHCGNPETRQRRRTFKTPLCNVYVYHSWNEMVPSAFEANPNMYAVSFCPFVFCPFMYGFTKQHNAGNLFSVPRGQSSSDPTTFAAFSHLQGREVHLENDREKWVCFNININ